MNFQNHLFRCSALGKIISKSGTITQGIETYLHDVFIGAIYGVEKEITSKYLDKGNACEQDGIQMLQDVFFSDLLLIKNTKPYKNGFIKGTPDLIMENNVFDIKNAYDLFTFGKAHLSHDYEWQLKGYQWLTGNTKGGVFYVLSDMPDFLLSDEERKLFYQGKFQDISSSFYIEACEELRKKFIYNYMKLEERFKYFEVSVQDSDIETIKKSVENARKRLQEMWFEHCVRIEKNQKLILKHNKTLELA